MGAEGPPNTRSPDLAKPWAAPGELEGGVVGTLWGAVCAFQAVCKSLKV